MEDDYEEEAYIIKEDVSEAQSSRSYDPDADVEEVKPRFDYFKYFLPNYKKDGDDDARPIKKVSTRRLCFFNIFVLAFFLFAEHSLVANFISRAAKSRFCLITRFQFAHLSGF